MQPMEVKLSSAMHSAATTNRVGHFHRRTLTRAVAAVLLVSLGLFAIGFDGAQILDGAQFSSRTSASGNNDDAFRGLQALREFLHSGGTVPDEKQQSFEERMDRLGLSADPDLFRREFDPIAAKVVERFREPKRNTKHLGDLIEWVGEKSPVVGAGNPPTYNRLKRFRQKTGPCKSSEVEPYVKALENVLADPLYYDGEMTNCGAGPTDELCCPVNVVFYFESNTAQDLDAFLRYIKPLGTRCVIFAGHIEEDDSDDARVLKERGYTLVSKDHYKQRDIIYEGYQHVRANYGDDAIVTPNDLDHYMAWRHRPQGEKFYRYSSYSEMVLVYALDMLTTDYCPSKKDMGERFTQPCTCFLEDNRRYIHNDETVFSTYGVTNRFNNYNSFYVKDIFQPGSIGTSFGNLAGVTGAHACHHLAGKSKSSKALHAGVVHMRKESQSNALNKYMKFSHDYLGDMLKKGQNIDAFIGCSLIDDVQKLWFQGNHDCPAWRGTKSLSNAITVAHQSYLCAEAGYDADHCWSDMGCCLTWSGDSK